MNLYLKKLELRNFCNYKESTFQFTNEDGEPYQFICFFGPNGIGKSSLLQAIQLLSMNTEGRGEDRVAVSLRRFVRSPDYNPSYEELKGFRYQEGTITGKDGDLPPMLLRGTYVHQGKEYIVELGNEGFIRNDFAPIADEDAMEDEAIAVQNSGPWGENHLKFRQRICHTVIADNDLSFTKFQLISNQVEVFEKLVSEVTSYPVECIKPTGMSQRERQYATDVVFHKSYYGEPTVTHFKRMSDGEKKVCKSFSDLLNTIYGLAHPIDDSPVMEGWPPILVFDNIEFHVHYARHVGMVNCMKSQFDQQQIFATTHSGTLIERHLRNENDKRSELFVDLEEVIR